VVDVGCGIGAWLSVFQEQGVNDVVGVDGDYVPAASLLVSARDFTAHDLETPLRLDRTFDLAVSLEVAEHLPASSADNFVDSLCRLAPLVLFSAAVPGQGGRAHVNEQWQSYWARRFAKHGFSPADVVRPRIWDDPEIPWWYSQNTLLYGSEEAWSARPELRPEGPLMLDVVHPRMFINELTTPELAAQLRRAIVNSARIRLGRLSR
jgi:SAM-dependent methyltransferase